MTDDHISSPPLSSPSLNPPPLVPSSSPPASSPAPPPASSPNPPTLPTPFTDPTSARYADEFLRLAPVDPGPLGLGHIRRSIRTAVGNSRGYLLDPYTQSSIISAIDYIARESVTFRRMHAFSQRPPVGIPLRPLALDTIIFTTLREFDSDVTLQARNWGHLYHPFSRPGRQDNTTAYINIPPAPDIFANPNEWFAWVQILVHELVHLMTGALDPLPAFQRQELGPTELITNEIFGELPENLALPRYAYAAPGMLSHIAVLNRLGYDAARSRTPVNEFDMRFLSLRIPRARRGSSDSIRLAEVRERSQMIDASTRHIVEVGTERLHVNNRVFPETRVSVTQGSTGAHLVVTLDNVYIEENGTTRRGSLRLEYVGEFDLRQSLVEVGGDVSNFPYGFRVAAGNRNLQAFFIPDAGAREPAPPGVYVRRNGRWERYMMQAGALPTETPHNDTEYGQSFFAAVRRKVDSEAPSSETTVQHYSNWLDKLGLKPVKNALFWLKRKFEYVAAHYPINRRRRAVGDDPGAILSPSEVHQMTHDVLFRVSDKINAFRVSNALRTIFANTSIWSISPGVKIYTEHYYYSGSPSYLDFRSNQVGGFLAISLMAYNFSRAHYTDILKPTFELYKYLTRNAVVLMNPTRDEIVVFDDTAGENGNIERRYNVAVVGNPVATEEDRRLIVGAPDRITMYHGYFFMRDHDPATVLFHVISVVRPDHEAGTVRVSQPDYMVLAPQIGGREFVPYLREYLEALEQSTVLCDDATGRLLLGLKTESGHGDHGSRTLTLLMPEPCDIRHDYRSEHTEDGYLTARYKILSLTYARVFTMQYSLNTRPGSQWTRQPTVWPVVLNRSDGTAYTFEEVLKLPLAHQIAAAVLGIADMDGTETDFLEATWMEWRRTLVNPEDTRHTFNTVAALADRPRVIKLVDRSRVIVLQDRDIYDLGLLGDLRLNFRGYREGCLALYMDAGGYVVAWDRMGVSFDPTRPRGEQLQTTKIETDYLVRPRSSVDDMLNVYSNGAMEVLYVWESTHGRHPLLITASEFLLRTYAGDSRHEIIKDQANALVEHWLHKIMEGDRTPEQELCILQALAHTDGILFDMTLYGSDRSRSSHSHRFTYTVPDHWPEGVTTLQGILYQAAEGFYASTYNDIYLQSGTIAIDQIALSLRVLVKRDRPEEATRVRIQKT